MTSEVKKHRSVSAADLEIDMLLRTNKNLVELNSILTKQLEMMALLLGMPMPSTSARSNLKRGYLKGYGRLLSN